MSYPLLEKINSPSDLKLVPNDQLPRLISEIRAFLIENITAIGGHLSSNLGVVELTLAIHRAFDSPRDRVIFDVGHQSYVHKLITGRRSAFSSLRRPGGLSGFSLPCESPHDQFISGHASTSLSAAIGLAVADRLRGVSSHSVVVLGDGAYGGGMIHEAIGNLPKDLPIVVVINENRMSVSKTRGSYAEYFSSVSSSEKNRFRSLGYSYIGVINGNDYNETERALLYAKRLRRAVFVHIRTVKGKGYLPAERDPEKYHSLRPDNRSETFGSRAADMLMGLARRDSRIVAITPAMGFGAHLDKFSSAYPNRFFDVGIAEPHALTFAAGLAAGGLLPFVFIYSSFLQRAYDSVLHDIAICSYPVKILIDKTGLNLSDGQTHHGIFDAAFLSEIPGLEILSPLSYRSLEGMLEYSLSVSHPLAIRYPSLEEPGAALDSLVYLSKYVLVSFNPSDPPPYIFVAHGQAVERALGAVSILASRGIPSGVIAIERLKPLSEICAEIASIIGSARSVLLCEEGIKEGGICERIVAILAEAGSLPIGKCSVSAVSNSFASPDEPCDIHNLLGLSSEKLAEKIIKI